MNVTLVRYNNNQTTGHQRQFHATIKTVAGMMPMTCAEDATFQLFATSVRGCTCAPMSARARNPRPYMSIPHA
jgi:hypothetical protein